MLRRCAFILCCLALAGCAGKKPVQDSTSPADFVAVTLGDAAQTAHGELAMLAKLRGQGLQPLLPASLKQEPNCSIPAWVDSIPGIMGKFTL